MKLKLDENLGLRGKAILVGAGHYVCTVADQSLAGYEDRDLIERCRAESRGLVTLDLDFANPLIFLPSQYPGIAVLRLPPARATRISSRWFRRWRTRWITIPLKESFGLSNRRESASIRNNRRTNQNVRKYTAKQGVAEEEVLRKCLAKTSAESVEMARRFTRKRRL